MEQKREPEIDPHKYNKLIFEREAEITQCKKKNDLSSKLLEHWEKAKS